MRVRRAKQRKRRAQTSNFVMPQGQVIVCSYVRCGKIFTEPIELTVRAEGSLETYYACPHCFSRVNVSDNLEKSLSKAPHRGSRKVLKESVNGIDEVKPASCAHFVGYLKALPKDSRIPDDCLTCSRLLECM